MEKTVQQELSLYQERMRAALTASFLLRGFLRISKRSVFV